MRVINPLEILLESEDMRRYISRKSANQEPRGQYSYVNYFLSAFFPTGNCAL